MKIIKTIILCLFLNPMTEAKGTITENLLAKNQPPKTRADYEGGKNGKLLLNSL